MVVHGRAYAQGTHAAAVAHGGLDHFAEGEHAHQVAQLHHHQRADVFFSHHAQGNGKGFVRCHGVEGVPLDAKDVADFHGVVSEGALGATG